MQRALKNLLVQGTLDGAPTSGTLDLSNLTLTLPASISSGDYKQSVRVATTGNGTLATAFENGDTVDGVVLSTGDRILLKDQSSQAANGIYVVAASGSPARASDFDSWLELPGAVVTVEAGTANAGTQWLCNVVAGGTLGTTAITFVVPKNFVDLTTNQTVGGIKTFTLAPVFTDASGTRTALGLAIGTNVQAYDADLTTWAGITPGANVGTFLATPSSANLAAAVTDETGTGLLVFNTSPSLISPSVRPSIISFGTILASAATSSDKTATFPNATGTVLLDSAIGVSVQAYDADLTTWAGITPGANVGAALAVAVGTDGAFVVKGGALGTPTSGTLTNCTIPFGGITGIVHSIYKRNGVPQTLTSATNVTMSFPTSVKTNAAFNGTTFTAPSSGLAKVTVGFDIYCTAVIGDSEKGNLALFIRDATAATNAHLILEDIILPFFTISGDSSFYTAFELSGAFDAISGHAYQIFCFWDNGGDNAYTQRGFAEWEMK